MSTDNTILPPYTISYQQKTVKEVARDIVTNPTEPSFWARPVCPQAPTPKMKLIASNGCTWPEGQQPAHNSVRPCWVSRSILDGDGAYSCLLTYVTLFCLFLDFNDQGVKQFGCRIEEVPLVHLLPCLCHWRIWILKIVDLPYQKICGPSCPSRHHDLQVDVSSKVIPPYPSPLPGIPMGPFSKTFPTLLIPTSTSHPKFVFRPSGPLVTTGCPSYAALRSRIWIVIHCWRALPLSKRCNPFPLKRQKEKMKLVPWKDWGLIPGEALGVGGCEEQVPAGCASQGIFYG